MNETKKEFASVVEKLIPMESPLLICLNKIDLFQDFSSKEPELTLSFKELLNLDKLDLPWKMIFTSALTGEGIVDGLKWIVAKLMEIS